LRALGLSVLCVITGTLSTAIATPRVRLETGTGFDTNVTRAEGEQVRVEGGLLRLIADLEDARRLGGSVVGRIAYQGGAKHFFNVPDEDVVFQKLGATVQMGLRPWLLPGLRLAVQDRSSRQPLRSRDYTRLTGGPRLDARFDMVRLGVFADGSRLSYKPNPAFSATTWGGGLRAGLRLRPVDLSVHALLQRRAFEADRRDEVTGIGVQLRYMGPVLASVGYDLTANRSTATGAGFERHNVQASATLSLGASLLASVKASLQRFAYDDSQALQYEFVDDENRSSVTARLEWAVHETWSVVGNGGAWFSPFGTVGTEFERYTFLVGLAFNDG
jgi:hypothetical protein